MRTSHVLIPIDGQYGCPDALQLYVSSEGSLHSRATLLFVVDLNLAVPAHRIDEDLCRAGENRLKALAMELIRPNQAVRLRVRVGRPHEQIVAEAHSEPTDLIILSAHPKSFWGKLFSPKTTEWIVNHAPCPTLVLPATSGTRGSMQGEAREFLNPFHSLTQIYAAT